MHNVKLTRSILTVLIIICLLSMKKPGLASSQPEFSTESVLKHSVLWMGGNSEYANAPNTSSLDVGTGPNDDFTVECFFYVPTLSNNSVDALIYQPDSYRLYINFHDTTIDYILFFLNIIPGNDVNIYYGTNLSVGWHHVAAIYDNEYTNDWDYMAIYLDGNLVASSSSFEYTPGIWNSSSPFLLGINSDYTFDGYVEEIRLSGNVRYTGASNTIPAGPFTNDSDTRALWHFDETPGSTTFYDSSSNGNHLAGYNGATTVVFYENPVYIPLIVRP